jgi:hypothetical protein
MSHSFNRITPSTIAYKDIGAVLYCMEKHASAMHRLGTIAAVAPYETSDGKDNWNQCGAKIEFTDGSYKQINSTDSTTYHLLRITHPTPEPKPAPNIGVLRSTAIRAANKVVGAQLDFDLRPDNPNGAAAIEIAEYEFDAAVRKLAEALNSTTD